MHELTPVRASLEDAFMELTSSSVEYRSHAPAERHAGDRRHPLRGHDMTMTTIALTTPALRHRQAGIREAMRAEWTKLVSLRSTKWTLGIMAAGSLLVTYLSAHGALHHPRGWYQGFDPTAQALNGLIICALLMGVFGVLAVTGEFGTGTIRSSLTAMPRREVFFGAKVLVVAAVTLVVGLVLSFATFLFGQALLVGRRPDGQPRPAGRAARRRRVRRLPVAVRPARPRPRASSSATRPVPSPPSPASPSCRRCSCTTGR